MFTYRDLIKYCARQNPWRLSTEPRFCVTLHGLAARHEHHDPAIKGVPAVRTHLQKVRAVEVLLSRVPSNPPTRNSAPSEFLAS